MTKTLCLGLGSDWTGQPHSSSQAGCFARWRFRRQPPSFAARI